LFEGGEHGRLAARLATQVIKAYVDKQRRLPTKVAEQNQQVDVGAMWNEAGDEELHGGRFSIDVAKPRLPLATAAPGLR